MGRRRHRGPGCADQLALDAYRDSSRQRCGGAEHVIAKARLINHSSPTLVLGDKLEVRLNSLIPPERCLDALKAATLACRIPLRDPPPSVACSSLHGDGTIYQISYRVATSVDLVAARTELCTQLHRHLVHAGIGFAVPGVATTYSVSEPSPAKVLADSDLFGILHPTERDELAAHFRPVWLNPNDTLIRQGATVEALFIVVSGVVEVVVSEPGGPRVLDRISPGGSLGAIGLVTGVPFSATATALSRSRCTGWIKTVLPPLSPQCRNS